MSQFTNTRQNTPVEPSEDDKSDKSVNDESFAKLWQLLVDYKWRVIGLSLLISLSAALGTVGPQFVRIAFDTVIPSGEFRPFIWLGVAYLAFFLVRALLGYAGMFLSYAFTQSIISDIRMKAYNRLLRLPVTRFTNERSGSLVSRVVSDVNALEGMIQAGATRLMGQLFSIIVVAVILVVMDWRLSLVNLVVMPTLAFITRHYQGKLRAASRKIRARVGELTSVANEAIGNIQVVKGFANEKLEASRFSDVNDNYVRHNLDRRKDSGMMEGLITLTGQYGTGAIILFGGWMVTQGSLSFGELTAFLLYQGMLQRPVTSVMFFNNQLQAGMAALERVSSLLDATQETNGELANIDKGAIEFKDVTFTFPTGETPAIKDLSLSIEEGQSVAFVGPSGAGKSTITNLIGRLYDVDNGNINIAGKDVQSYDLETLRRAIAIVPQEPTLFSGSVRENIRYAKPEASDDEVTQAAIMANADTFVNELPKGYDTEIGERGIKLSGGQKQRIAIARAILKESKILIFDEATSALDSESEMIIQEALDGLFAKRLGVTSIIIAHRLSTIQGVDKIFVLDHGNLIQEGSHSELVNQDGMYQYLYELQFREEEFAQE